MVNELSGVMCHEVFLRGKLLNSYCGGGCQGRQWGGGSGCVGTRSVLGRTPRLVSHAPTQQQACCYTAASQPASPPLLLLIIIIMMVVVWLAWRARLLPSTRPARERARGWRGVRGERRSSTAARGSRAQNAPLRTTQHPSTPLSLCSNLLFFNISIIMLMFTF